MIPYEKMNPETKRVFEVADLFGAGGKSENAILAAQILTAAKEAIPWPQQYPDNDYDRGLRHGLALARSELVTIIHQLEAPHE